MTGFLGDRRPGEVRYPFDAALERHAARLREALRHAGDTHTLDDLRAAVAAGEMQVWEDERAVVVTEIVAYPRAKALHFFLAAGDMDAALVLHDAALGWGRGIGCDRATVAGRGGWERVLSKRGYARAWTVLARGIEA